MAVGPPRLHEKRGQTNKPVRGQKGSPRLQASRAMASADLRIIRRPTYRGFELTGWQVAVAWAFIFLAATFDTGFAWQYRAGIPEWELNPVACWCFRGFGAAGVVGLKVLTH